MSSARNMCAQQLSVRNFYEGKSILITGVTGGIGKLLIEKLMRSCSDVKEIYVLLRAKKNETVSERLTNLFNSPVFDRLRTKHADVFSKVRIVEGDLCKEDLGLSNCDIEALIENVSVVFHSAASLRFDSSLEEAIENNVFGTRRLVYLCKKMTKIEAFIHVSTLFSTCHRTRLEERIPSIPALNDRFDFSAKETDFMESLPANVADAWPNTYVFSKALTEVMLSDQRGSLNVSIVRPSVVLSTWKDPMPGWIDNFYGPTLSIVNGALGILRSLICHGEKVGDVIPADIVVNFLICVGCKTKYASANEIKVYNLGSSRQNPVKMKLLIDESLDTFRVYPPLAAIRYPDMQHRTSHLVHSMVSLVDHRLFAYILDFVSLCTSQRRRMVRIQNSLLRLLKLTVHFATREWTMFDHNVEMLNKELSEREREVFFFDVRLVNWKLYTKDYALGIRKHLLKEDLDNLDDAVAKMRNLYWIEKVTKLTLSISSIYLVYCLISRRRRRI